MLGGARTSLPLFALRMSPETSAMTVGGPRWAKGISTPLRKLQGAVRTLKGQNDEGKTKLLVQLCVVSGEESSMRSKRQGNMQREEAIPGTRNAEERGQRPLQEREEFLGDNALSSPHISQPSTVPVPVPCHGVSRPSHLKLRSRQMKWDQESVLAHRDWRTC